jgi:molybdopterin-guanine dinucleotide biosynthesis protein A
MKYPNIGGAILAGGRGSRLGFPKAFLEVGGRPLIAQVLDVMRRFFGEILIITDSAAPFSGIPGVLVVEDLAPECGPLGGVYTGLLSSSRKNVFFAACDMPFLQEGLIKRMLEEEPGEAWDAVVPYGPKGIEPLHAIYAKSALSGFEAALAKNEYAIRSAFSKLACRYIKAEPDELVSFFNINAPKDLEWAGKVYQNYHNKVGAKR